MRCTIHYYFLQYCTVDRYSAVNRPASLSHSLKKSLDLQIKIQYSVLLYSNLKLALTGSNNFCDTRVVTTSMNNQSSSTLDTRKSSKFAVVKSEHSRLCVWARFTYGTVVLNNITVFDNNSLLLDATKIMMMHRTNDSLLILPITIFQNLFYIGVEEKMHRDGDAMRKSRNFWEAVKLFVCSHRLLCNREES